MLERTAVPDAFERWNFVVSGSSPGSQRQIAIRANGNGMNVEKPRVFSRRLEARNRCQAVVRV